MIKHLLFCAALWVLPHAVSAQLTVRKVKPVDTDAQITTFTADSHYVYLNTTAPPKNILLVHLPGSFGEPKRATLFGSLAANLGFHSIGLMYPNVPTVGSFCSNDTDPDCFENVRREIIEGIDYSAELTINAPESILNRTKKLLQYLQANYPAENWGQYLDGDGNLVYNKIIFSGHSQGGGHAAVIAKHYPLYRAICFSSPKDWRNIPDAPPLWLSTNNWQTPASSVYAFNHIADEHTRQLVIWDSLGLNAYGTPVNVDSFSSPYSNTRQLTTAYAVTAGDEHASTIQDNKTPKVDGIPVFIPVWTYMLTHNMPTALPNYAMAVNTKVWPNPTDNVLNIMLPKGNYKLTVYNANGHLLLEKQTPGGAVVLATDNLPNGLYYINAQAATTVYKAKFIKQ